MRLNHAIPGYEQHSPGFPIDQLLVSCRQTQLLQERVWDTGRHWVVGRGGRPHDVCTASIHPGCIVVILRGGHRNVRHTQVLRSSVCGSGFLVGGRRGGRCTAAGRGLRLRLGMFRQFWHFHCLHLLPLSGQVVLGKKNNTSVTYLGISVDERWQT